MAERDRLLSLGGTQGRPDTPELPGRHRLQVIDMLLTLKLDLEEAGLVVDAIRSEAPEDHIGVFGRQNPIPFIVF